MKHVIFFVILILLFFWNWKVADESDNPLNWVAMGVCGMAAFVQVLSLGGII